MAYARLYRCDRLLLLYPMSHGHVHGEVHIHGLARGHERLDIASISLEVAGGATQKRLRELVCFGEPLDVPVLPKKLAAFSCTF